MSLPDTPPNSPSVDNAINSHVAKRRRTGCTATSNDEANGVANLVVSDAPRQINTTADAVRANPSNDPPVRQQRRGRPRKPDPVTNMTATDLIATKKTLTIVVLDGASEVARFQTNPPKQNKVGKVGWALSQKMQVDINSTSVACQITGNVYGIRSDKWAR